MTSSALPIASLPFDGSGRSHSIVMEPQSGGLTCGMPQFVGAAGGGVPLLRGKKSLKGQATAYVCERRLCRLPTADPEVFAQQLRKVEPLTGAEPTGWR